MIQSVNQVLATIALLIHVGLLMALLMFIYTKFSGKKSPFTKSLVSFLQKNSYSLAFLVALASVMTSLFWSEIMKFQPCILCWYQRIFMYPQPLLLYTALVRNERVLTPYLWVMSGVGMTIGLYHHLMQLLPHELALPCKAIGGVSCIEGYKFYYGYITFPLMSATAFLLIILFLAFSRKQSR